jgi:hypothetical protein
MKALRVCMAVCLLVLAVGCASPRPAHHKVTFDYDVDYDFQRVQTYDWVTMPGTLKINRFDRIRIEETVDKHLTARGLRRTAEHPDIYIIMYGGTFKQADLTVLKIDYEVYEVGRLKLAVYDTKSNKEVWWSETRADLFHRMTPEEKQEVIMLAVQKILDYYPPLP